MLLLFTGIKFIAEMTHMFKRVKSNLLKTDELQPMELAGFGSVSNGPIRLAYYHSLQPFSLLPRISRSLIFPKAFESMSVDDMHKLFSPRFIFAVRNCGHKHSIGTAKYLKFIADYYTLVSCRLRVTQIEWNDIKEKLLSIGSQFKEWRKIYEEKEVVRKKKKRRELYLAKKKKKQEEEQIKKDLEEVKKKDQEQQKRKEKKRAQEVKTTNEVENEKPHQKIIKRKREKEDSNLNIKRKKGGLEGEKEGEMSKKGGKETTDRGAAKETKRKRETASNKKKDESKNEEPKTEEPKKEEPKKKKPRKKKEQTPFLGKELIDDIHHHIDTLINIVDGLFETYGNVNYLVKLILGRWSQDYIEHLFGAARASMGTHDGITLLSLLRCLSMWQFDLTQEDDVVANPLYGEEKVVGTPKTSRYVSNLQSKHNSLTTITRKLPPKRKEKPKHYLVGQKDEEEYASELAESRKPTTHWKAISLFKTQLQAGHNMTAAGLHTLYGQLRLPQPTTYKSPYAQPKSKQKIAKLRVLDSMVTTKDGEQTSFSNLTKAIEYKEGALIRITRTAFNTFFIPMCKAMMYYFPIDKLIVNQRQAIVQLLEDEGLNKAWHRYISITFDDDFAKANSHVLKELKWQVIHVTYRKFMGSDIVPLANKQLDENTKNDSAMQKGKVGIRTALKVMEGVKNEEGTACE